MAVAAPTRPDPDEVWQRLMARDVRVVVHDYPDGRPCVHVNPIDNDDVDHGIRAATLGEALELALSALSALDA